MSIAIAIGAEVATDDRVWADHDRDYEDDDNDDRDGVDVDDTYDERVMTTPKEIDTLHSFFINSTKISFNLSFFPSLCRYFVYSLMRSFVQSLIRLLFTPPVIH